MGRNIAWPIGTKIIVPDFKCEGEIIQELDLDLYEIQLFKGPIIVTRSASFRMIDYPKNPETDRDYIRINKLIDGGLYYIEARNSSYGIWLYEELGFVIRRQKMNNIFLFVEYHFDTGWPFGTVYPKIFLEKCPFTMDALQISKGTINYVYEDIILEYLKRKEDYYGNHNPKK